MLYVLYLNLLPPVVTVTNLEEILNEITHQHPTPLAHNMHMLQESAQKGYVCGLCDVLLLTTGRA